MRKVKVLLKCVYGEHQPGEQVEVSEETAKHYSTMGWMKVIETVMEPEVKPEVNSNDSKQSKPRKKKATKK